MDEKIFSLTVDQRDTNTKITEYVIENSFISKLNELLTDLAQVYCVKSLRSHER